MRPYCQMACIDRFVMPLSMSVAMTVGMRISMIASTTTNNGESRLAFVYSRIDPASVLIVCIFAGFRTPSVAPVEAVAVLMWLHLLSYLLVFR